jgi:hypothetical protein
VRKQWKNTISNRIKDFVNLDTLQKNPGSDLYVKKKCTFVGENLLTDVFIKTGKQIDCQIKNVVA